MQVLGKKEFFYTLPGETVVFPSALFHETITALSGTMKLSILFCYKQRANTALHEDMRTTRKALQQHTLAETTQKRTPFDIIKYNGKVGGEDVTD